MCSWTLGCSSAQHHSVFLGPLGKDGGCLDPTWSFGLSVTVWWRDETLRPVVWWLGHCDAWPMRKWKHLSHYTVNGPPAPVCVLIHVQKD